MPPPPQITPAPGPETPQENTYPYVVFWIDKDASLRALEGDARFKGSAAIRLMIINAPERKYVGYLYQVRASLCQDFSPLLDPAQISSGDPNDANIKSQYQVFCVRRGLPPEVREQGLLPDMCVAVSSSNVVEDTRHRRPLQPSTTLPWAGCYHASFDIVPITINSTHQATLSKNLTTAPGKPCPVLSEKEVERHGGIIASDLKHRAKLPGKPKQPKESNEQGAATSRSPVPRVGTIQRQSWALITVNVSFSFDEDSKRDICLDPSDLIRLQSDLVTEVSRLRFSEEYFLYLSFTMIRLRNSAFANSRAS